MEEFYKLMQEQKWSEILLLAKTKHNALMRNQAEWQSICRFLESEFISYISNEKYILVGKLCFEYLRLELAKYIYISESARNTIEDIGFSALEKSEPSSLIAFSKLCIHSTNAKEFIEKTKEKEVAASQRLQSTPTGKPKAMRVDWLQPLFKSKLESEFYQALKNVFPTYFIYPNVALSNIFEFDKIQEHLEVNSKNYFFKAIIDFVVYDPTDNHTPKYFFEVDSAYHDTDKAKLNDELKNGIFSIANIELFRIRPSDQIDGNRFGFETAIRTKVSHANIKN
ncbi:DUF2726 domain-containing protein [Aeromonas salmonicida]